VTLRRGGLRQSQNCRQLQLWTAGKLPPSNDRRRRRRNEIGRPARRQRPMEGNDGRLLAGVASSRSLVHPECCVPAGTSTRHFRCR